MKRTLLAVAIFFLTMQIVFSQDSGNVTSLVNSASSLDGAVKGVAALVNQRLRTEGQAKVAVFQFAFEERIPVLGNYWNAQLVQELATIPNRSWSLLSDNAGSADLTVSGEIVEIVNTIRVYTRIIRTGDHSIILSIQSDFARDAFITEMLAGGSGGSSFVARDAYEPDSMSNPLPVEIGASADAARVYNRTIHSSHSSNDEDFFQLTPEQDGLLTAETTGNMDTYMYLYDADTGRELASNDDGGSSSNARIRQRVQAGSRYIAKVKGYSGDTGSYGFFAYLVPEVRLSPDEFEPDNDFATAKEIDVGTPQQHTFHNGDDVDYVKFTITQTANYTIRAQGLNSNSLDTFIELFDSQQRSIDEDDDGGSNLDSRISRRLEPGTCYLKASCLDDNPDQPYVISITKD